MKLKQLYLGLLLLTAQAGAWAQVYNLYGPANGIQKGSTSTYQNTAAVSSDVIALWTTGVCNSTTFLRGDSACQLINLATNVTGTLPAASVGAAGSNTQIQYNNSGVLAASSSLTWTNSTQKLNIAGQLIFSPISSADIQSTLGNDLSVGVPGSPSLCTNVGATAFYMGYQVGSNGDYYSCSSQSNPLFVSQMADNTAENSGLSGLLNSVTVSNFLGLSTDSTTGCPGTAAFGFSFAPAVSSHCMFLAADIYAGSTNYPMVFAFHQLAYKVVTDENHQYFAIGLTTPVKWQQVSSTGTNQANVTLGDTNSSSVTNIVGGSSANTQANGKPILTGFSATSAAIGGSALLAGQCSAGTVTVTGATTSMTSVATPSSDPDSVLTTGIAIYSFVSASNTVTIRVCAIVAVTPAAVTYNVRVLQ